MPWKNEIDEAALVAELDAKEARELAAELRRVVDRQLQTIIELNKENAKLRLEIADQQGGWV